MGAKIWQSKARSAPFRDFPLHQSLTLANSARCFPRLRPPGCTYQLQIKPYAKKSNLPAKNKPVLPLTPHKR